MADLLEQLRTGTRPLHDRLDGAALSARVMDGTLSAEDYRRLIDWQLHAHLVAEHGLLGFAWPGDYRYVSRLPALLAEMTHLGLSMPNVEPLAVPRSMAEATGRAYVWSVLRSVGDMILGHLRGNVALRDCGPFPFYDFQRREGLAQWRKFVAFAKTLDMDAGAQETCVAAAKEVFGVFASVGERSLD